MRALAFILALPFLFSLAYYGRLSPSAIDRAVAANELECSSIAFVQPDILKDVRKLPVAIRDWGQSMNNFGDVNGILVPFSRAPGSTSLSRPRVLLSIATQFSTNHPRDPFPAKRDLTTRLFIGVTTAPDKSQTMEFISWNQKSRRYDFGVIEHFEDPTKRNLVVNNAKRQECIACHRTGGPIFPVFPWTGMSVDPILSVAMIEEAYRLDPKRYEALHKALEIWKERSNDSVGTLRLGITAPEKKTEPEAKLLREATLFLNGRDTGVRFLEERETDRTAVFDSAVRSANRNLSLPNEILNALPAATRPLAARIVILRSLLEHYGEFAPDILKKFPDYLKMQQRALIKMTREGKDLPHLDILSSRASEILDYDPVSGMPKHSPIATSDDHLSYVATIRAYNAKREKGDIGVPANFLPSTPPAFRSEDNPPVYTLAGAILDGMPGQILLHRKDLDPLLDFLETTSADKGYNLLRAVLESPRLSAITQHGLPNRETLLPVLYVAALDELRRQNRSLSGFPDITPRVAPLTACDGAGTAPVIELPKAGPEKACARCHVGADKVGRMRFAFDPEDRGAWTAAYQDPKRREATKVFAAKVLRRLESDSMPPEESPERTMLNKNSARAESVRSLRDFLKGLK